MLRQILYSKDSQENSILRKAAKDRAKQRMYKRYDRALDPNKKASKIDLSYGEYYEWLEAATKARDAYLAGKISEEEALNVIQGDFISKGTM